MAKKRKGLYHKYFVLKPEGTDIYAMASREAIMKYASLISKTNYELAQELFRWIEELDAE